MPYQCNEMYYDDLLLLKTFANTSAFVKREDRELNIYLVGSGCKVVYQEEINKNVEFFEADDLLILKTSNEYIFVFDKN